MLKNVSLQQASISPDQNLEKCMLLIWSTLVVMAASCDKTADFRYVQFCFQIEVA